ncbi:sulfotransferase family protein [Flavobacterium sp. ANB]|uniref:sulfotransferase family protein n=1 Tax=unclassified Flavobacterium TaxID=196869 RepID=UPI0012B786FE|nr:MULTISPECIES: sulfotransferase family protein [unclassified Flavobacterium]MBF4518081.1 sulfotransferase family protein [Flavobacterium sp. ANB]MTD71175.1 sulfotransferase family protein [Flavobacterium sp. LC2016-13]
MENIHHPLFNWIPNNLVEKDNQVYFEWIYLGDLKYVEPFFDETILKCLSHEYNSKAFKIISTVENLIEWSEELISVELKSLVFHVSRCGSTMLSQSLATSSENIMISEAPIIDQILRSDLFSLGKKEVLIKAVLKLLGQKRFPEQQHLIIKLDAWHIFKAPYLRFVFPQIPFALLYRNPTEVLKSHQKKMGMHMVPNVLPANVFGISAKEMEEISFQQYGALVLEKYFQGFLDFYEEDKNVTILNYNEGMKQVVEQFLTFINANYSNNELDKMYDRLQKHSKNENADFTGDAFKEESLQIDFETLTILHDKLNNKFLEYSDR